MTPDNHPGYQTPILASIFRCVGAVAFLGAVFFAYIGSAGMASGGARGPENGASVFFLALAPAFGWICLSLFFFGIGQIMDFIGRIAFNTGRLCELGEGQTFGKGGKPPVGSIRAVPITRTKPPQPAVEPVSEGRRFYYSIAEETLGPVSESELQTLANQGTITAETYICPEGSQEWRRLDEINEG